MPIFDAEKLQTDNKGLDSKNEKSSSNIDRLSAVVDNTYEWVWEVDKNGVYTNASEQVFSVLGYQPKEVIGKTPFDFMSASEAQRVSAIFGEIVAKQISFSKLRNICLHKDGTEVHTETSGKPLYDKDGLFCGYQGIDFDRTEEMTETQGLKDINSTLQEKINEQHQLLLNVTNSISDLLFYKDMDFRYIGCNQAFSDFLGLPIEFIVGRTDYDLFAKEFADLFRLKDTETVQSLQTQSNHEWVAHADGRMLYLLTQKSPLIDVAGKMIGLVGISRDLSETHDLENQLHKANSHLIEAQNIAKIGHWDLDIETGNLVWSDEIYKIFGYKIQEFHPTYDTFLETIHPEDRQMVTDAVENAVENMNDYDIYHRIVLPDTTEKIVHEVGHALYDAAGKPKQMIGTVQDVTQMKRIEQELADQKEAFETIFEYTTDGMILMEDGKFITCNQAIVDMMQVSGKEEVLNVHPSEFSPDFQPDGQSSLQKADEMIAICMQQGNNHFEWVHTRKNGEAFWAEVLLTRLSIKGKPIIHASLRDISERKALEEKLETANSMYIKLVDELDTKVKEQSAHIIKQSRMAQMGELLSMIAHQWRQPLSSIAAIASTVKIKASLARDGLIHKESSPYLTQKMDEIETLLQNLSGTIDDFRTLYKPNKNMVKVSVTEPIERALKIMEMSFHQHRIKVHRSYDAETLVQIHSNEVMQVLLNLFKNAEDNFLEKNVTAPSIKINTAYYEDSIRIEVSDNGGGIDERLIEQIFDPYFSTKHEKNGTGLGLYMCKIIIEQQHKGRLYARNISNGAAIYIELPIIKEVG
jgi:PAS domain S-box-containing protein